MNVSKLTIYKAAIYICSINDLRSSDVKTRRSAQNDVIKATNGVIKPDITDLDLDIRKQTILVLGGLISLIGIILVIFTGLLGAFGLPLVLLNCVFFISFNLLASGLFIIWFRYSIAAADHSRFLRLDDKSKFKINKLAHSTWFDLLSGAPIGALIMYDLLSR